MVKGKTIVILGLVALVILFILGGLGDNVGKKRLLGSSYSPANIPSSSIQDIQNFFVLSNDIGMTHMQFGTSWGDEARIEDIRTIQTWTEDANLDYHLFLSPLLFEDRKQLSVPSDVSGNSFSDSSVRTAFKSKALEFASLRPEILGIGTEVNLLAPNTAEYEAYKTLAKETYDAIKQQYPNQKVTISFHWDPMYSSNDFSFFDDFSDSSDILSLTTYPNSFGSVNNIPLDYYSKAKQVFPSGDFAISEIGWGTIPNNNVQWQIQADFYGAVPSLTQQLDPEFITIASMHDTNVFTGQLAGFNFLGIRTLDSQPKPAWETLLNADI